MTGPTAERARKGRWCLACGVATLVTLWCACDSSPIDDYELLRQVRDFETRTEAASPWVKRKLLEEFAAGLVHRHVTVSSAVVASTYRRHNITRVYFGTDYDESNHLYLSAIDADFQQWFERHEHWVSIVKTYPDRQISFELAVDPTTALCLDRGQPVAFVCELAAVIRGKSVYCRALEVRPEIATGDDGCSVEEELVATRIH